jgi:hypothetical protein
MYLVGSIFGCFKGFAISILESGVGNYAKFREVLSLLFS